MKKKKKKKIEFRIEMEEKDKIISEMKTKFQGDQRRIDSNKNVIRTLKKERNNRECK